MNRLVYIDPTVIIPGIPARDLNEEETQEVLARFPDRDAFLAMRVYKLVQSKPRPAENKLKGAPAANK